MTLQWEPESIADRTSIFDYICADSPRAALEVDDRILHAIRSLKTLPEKGRPGRVVGTRELVITGTRYLAAYRIEGNTIIILRIVDGARRWPRMTNRP